MRIIREDKRLPLTRGVYCNGPGGKVEGVKGMVPQYV